MDIKRRHVLKTVPMVAGAGLLELNLPKLFAQSAQPLNQTMLNTVHENIGTALTNITNGAGKTSDYQTIYNNVATLVSNMVAANSDVAFKAAASGVTYANGALNGVAFNASSMATSIYNVLTPYAPHYSYSSLYTQVNTYGPWGVQTGDPAVFAQQINSQLLGLSHTGSLPWLNRFQTMINSYLEDPQDPTGVCQEINALFWFWNFSARASLFWTRVRSPLSTLICSALFVIDGIP